MFNSLDCAVASPCCRNIPHIYGNSLVWNFMSAPPMEFVRGETRGAGTLSVHSSAIHSLSLHKHSHTYAPPSPPLSLTHTHSLTAAAMRPFIQTDSHDCSLYTI